MRKENITIRIVLLAMPPYGSSSPIFLNDLNKTDFFLYQCPPPILLLILSLE